MNQLEVFRLRLTASSFDGQARLGDVFLKALQKVIDEGGSIISIVKDEPRLKLAYVLRYPEKQQ